MRGPRKGDSGRSAPSREPAVSDEERRLFEQAMKDVRPLPVDPRRRVPPVPARPTTEPPRANASGVSTTSLSIEESGEQVTALAAGVDRRLLRRLRAGDVAVEATLDLHGLSQEAAVRALEKFIESGGRRCVLVIHGRGQHSGAAGPVLARATRDCLAGPRLRSRLLAFVSAPPALGGAGALLVLLRKG